MLHTINKSPFTSNTFQTSVRFFQSGDPVLFIEDGVYGVQANNKFSDSIKDILNNNPIYALGDRVSPQINQLINIAQNIIIYSKGAMADGDPIL